MVESGLAEGGLPRVREGGLKARQPSGKAALGSRTSDNLSDVMSRSGMLLTRHLLHIVARQ